MYTKKIFFTFSLCYQVGKQLIEAQLHDPQVWENGAAHKKYITCLLLVLSDTMIKIKSKEYNFF